MGLGDDCFAKVLPPAAVSRLQCNPQALLLCHRESPSRSTRKQVKTEKEQKLWKEDKSIHKHSKESQRSSSPDCGHHEEFPEKLRSDVDVLPKVLRCWIPDWGWNGKWAEGMPHAKGRPPSSGQTPAPPPPPSHETHWDRVAQR